MTRRPLWIGALAVSLLVLALHSRQRLRDLETVTDTRVGAGVVPAVDPTSPSGYRWGQHRLVLPESDSYLWLLQAERSLAGGGLRVRMADYDNAPAGREVHWAGFQRWWALGLAAADRLIHPELTAPQALERVAPWANTALLALFLLIFTPLIAARLNGLSASVFALGAIAVHPAYAYLQIGFFDHHGPAIVACLAAVLLPIAGGAGWVRSGDGSGDRWLPAPRGARLWFGAAGCAGAVGLWISAATAAPVLVGIGLGALLAVVAGARVASAGSATRFEPGLFRVWGVAGAATSFVLYLLEYFPSNVGIRLEVNHPLYALAFLGGGDLIARAATVAGAARSDAGRSRSALAWLAADLALVLQLPVVILVTRAATFRVADPVLWVFHTRYINEFLDLSTHVRSLTPAQVVGRLSLVPLIGLPIAAVLWSGATTGPRRVWRAALALAVAVIGAYAHVFFVGLTGGQTFAALLLAVGAVAVGFGVPLARRAAPLAPRAQAALVMTVLPALVMLWLALGQERWLGIASALWLAVAVVAAGVLLDTDPPAIRSASARGLAGALALMVLAVAPAFALREPYAPPNVGLIARDASLWLRRRQGADPAVVFASPTATAYMIWFGGFRGIGTLYWENLEGLRASAEICGAPDADASRALLARHGVTHVAAFAWDGGLEQLRAALLEAPGQGGWPPPDGRPAQSFCSPVPGDVPAWLVPLPYVPPRVGGYGHPAVRLYEVADALPPELVLLRLARYYQALEDPRMDEALDRSLALRATVGGLAMRAQIQSAQGDRPAVAATADRLRAELTQGTPVDPVDRIEAVVALALARDGEGARRELDSALAEVDERVLRRIAPERLSLAVELARQLGLDRTHPEPIALAEKLLAGG